MNEIEHEGKTYILKNQVESIIKERVSKVAQRATEAENQLSALNKELDQFKNKQASIDMLTDQINSLKSDLKTSETKFNRYQNMTKLGISEPELIEAIEWQYDKSMSDKSGKDIIPLNDWLQNHIQNVEEAPLAIRPHLQNLQHSMQESGGSEHEENPEMQQYQQQLQEISEPLQQYQAPQTNRGAVPPPEGKDILRHAMSQNQEYYNQNAEAIKKAFMARYGR